MDGWQGARSRAADGTRDSPTYSSGMDNTLRETRHRGTRARAASFLRWSSVALTLVLLAACVREGPEAALRGRVASLAEAVDQREPAALQQHLAADFIGNGGLDRDGARRLAVGLVLRHRDTGIVLGPLQVELAQGYATVRTTAVLRGGSGGLLPDSAQAYEVESGWRLEDGEWMLASLRWEPML